METVTPSISVTIPNPTQGQIQALMDILESTQGATTTTTKTKKTKPLKTAAPDTESEMDEEELSSDDGAEETDEDEAEETDADEEDDGLTFDTVKDALNKYGSKHPDEAKAILLGFNIKSTKELSQHKKKWEPVFRKVMAKLKKTKGK